MANNDPLVEIPLQPKPDVPTFALENISPPSLDKDLQAYELMDKQISLRRKEYDLHVESVMLGQRKKYAFLFFVLTLYWLVGIAVFMVFVGMGKLKLADSVLITLLSTTTANVFGLLYIFARWLFPGRTVDKVLNENTNDSKS